jgi:hypothetical protein
MADNFSDKVVKKLQKQNLAVDLTEEIVEEAVPEAVPETVLEEAVIQSQDVQSMGANDVTAFSPGQVGGLTMLDAIYKDIIISPGPRNSGQTQSTASQINFYNSTSAVAFDTTGYDQQYRATIFNYIEGDAAPALVIGGYNGINYAPTTTWGGTTGLTVAKIWIHPFTGKVDASIFDGNKLVLSQTNNTPQISFGNTATTQSSLATAGDLAWDGTTFKVHNGTSVQTLAYSSEVPGAQFIFKNMFDGTNTATADGVNDTFTFTAGNGITCTINASTDTLTIATANIPNGSLTNSAVTIGSTSVSLGSTVTTFTGLSSVTSTTFVGALNGNANTATSAATLTTARNIQGVSFNGSADITVVTNGTGVTVSGTSVSIGQVVGTSSAVTFGSVAANSVRIGNSPGTVDTSSGNLILDSTGGQVTINDNVVITGSSVTLAAASTSTISANSNKITNVATPTVGTDAANKSYVDGLIQGLDVHDNVRAMAATAINTSVLYFQTNAASSTSGTATGTCYIESSANQALSAAYFDNITLNSGSITTGDRVLVTAGASTATYNIGGVTTTPTGGVNVMNGVYVVTNAGSVSTKWRLDRALDSDDNIELEGGTFVFVQEGDVYKDTGWLMTNNTSVTKLSIGSDAITFTQFSSAGQIEAGTGLLKNGNTINAQGTTNRISVSPDNIDIDANYAGQTSITTLGTIGTGTWNASTIAVAKGGTGATSFTANTVLYGNGTGAIQATSVAGTSGQLLVANATGVPTFVSLGGDASLVAAGTLTLNTVNSNTGGFGTSTAIPAITVNGKGLITAVSTNTIPDATTGIKGIASFSSSHFSVTSGAVSLSTVAIASGGLNRTTAISGFVYGDGTGYAAATAANLNSLHGTQTANTVYAAPNGSSSVPSFRALVAADLPTATVSALGVASFNTSHFSVAAGAVSLNTVTIAKGGTNATGQTGNGITYFDSTSIVSGNNLTFNPTNNGATTSSALYVNAGSATTGTAMYVNAGALAAGNVLVVNGFGTTGKLISGQTSGTEKFSVDVNGNLRATTKSFDIPHPTKEGKRLVYGVLEGPEHGVYHRGTVEGKDKIKIELPEYWYKLVGENYSVQLTSWGPYAVHLVEKTENYFIIQLSSNIVMRKLKTIKVDYVVHGARLDAPLEIEQ